MRETVEVILASTQTFWAAMTLGFIGYWVILTGLVKGRFNFKGWFAASALWWGLVAALSSTVR
jgi:hypothetical protein